MKMRLIYIAHVSFAPMGEQTEVCIADSEGFVIYNDRWYVPPTIEVIAEQQLKMPANRLAFYQHEEDRWKVYLVI